MLACVDAGDVKKAETPTSPIATAPETAANIFVKRVMCASLSTGARRCECTRSKTAGQRCALVHAAWFSAFTGDRSGTRSFVESGRYSAEEVRAAVDELLGELEAHGQPRTNHRGVAV